jgi:hypothetical protein
MRSGRGDTGNLDGRPPAFGERSKLAFNAVPDDHATNEGD